MGRAAVGGRQLAADGARPSDPRAVDDFRVGTTAEPSVTIHGLEGGSPRLQKTVLPVHAQANVSIRLAPGQTPAAIAPVFGACCAKRRRRDDARGRALVDVRPRYVDPDGAAVVLALDAFEHVLGTRPVLARSGARSRSSQRSPRAASRRSSRASRGPRRSSTPRTRTSRSRRSASLETTVETLRRLGRLG